MNDVSTQTQTSGAGQPGHESGAPPSDPTERLAALTDAVAELARSQQAVLDVLRARADSPGPAAAAATDADVRRVVADALRERDASRAASAAREQYLRARMADLPEAY